MALRCTRGALRWRVMIRWRGYSSHELSNTRSASEMEAAGSPTRTKTHEWRSPREAPARGCDEGARRWRLDAPAVR